MPHRVLPLVLALAGALTVWLLLLAGADLYRQLRRGPRWKRRLVSAGMLLLGTSVVAGGCPREETDKPAQPVKQPPVAAAPTPAAPVEPALPPASDEERQIAAIVKQLNATLPKRAKDKADKARLVGQVERALALVDQMQAASKVNATEAALIKLDLEPLVLRVRRLRLPETVETRCYKRARPKLRGSHLARLQQRLPLLVQLAQAGRLNPRVVRKALAQVEADLKSLMQTPLPKHEGDQLRIQIVIQDMSAAVKKLRQKLGLPAR